MHLLSKILSFPYNLGHFDLFWEEGCSSLVCIAGFITGSFVYVFQGPIDYWG